MHKCVDSKIHCFDCNKTICEQCMSISTDSLRCVECDRRAKKKPAAVARKKLMSSNMALGLVTTFYSFVMIKFLNMLSFCLT